MSKCAGSFFRNFHFRKNAHKNNHNSFSINNSYKKLFAAKKSLMVTLVCFTLIFTLSVVIANIPRTSATKIPVNATTKVKISASLTNPNDAVEESEEESQKTGVAIPDTGYMTNPEVSSAQISYVLIAIIVSAVCLAVWIALIIRRGHLEKKHAEMLRQATNSGSFSYSSIKYPIKTAKKASNVAAISTASVAVLSVGVYLSAILIKGTVSPVTVAPLGQVSSSADIKFDLTLTNAGTTDSATSKVAITGAAEYGYSLFVSTENNTNTLRNTTDSTSFLIAVEEKDEEAIADLKSFSMNSWGIKSSVDNNWHAVPTPIADAENPNKLTKILVYKSTDPVEESTVVDVEYGIRANSRLKSGNYDGSIIYEVRENAVYKINYDSNAPENNVTNLPSATTSSDNPSADDEYTLSVDSSIPHRAGYTFLGWSEKSDATEPDENYAPSKEVVFSYYKTETESTPDSEEAEEETDDHSHWQKTLYAVWKQWDGVVDYDLNGGEGIFYSSEATITEEDESYEKWTFDLVSNVPVRTGYTFYGWFPENSSFEYDTFTTPGATSIYRPSDVHDYNLILKAVWLKDEQSYTVTYDLNGGNGENWSETLTGKEQYVLVSEVMPWYPTYGSEHTVAIPFSFTSITPTRDNYEFVRWEPVDADFYGTTAQYTQSDLTFKAIWSPTSININVNFWDRDELKDAQSATHQFDDNDKNNFANYGAIWDILQYFTETPPTRDGYTFVGWQCQGTCYQSGTAYGSYADISSSSVELMFTFSSDTPSTLTFNLYALWIKNDSVTIREEYYNGDEKSTENVTPLSALASSYLSTTPSITKQNYVVIAGDDANTDLTLESITDASGQPLSSNAYILYQKINEYRLNQISDASNLDFTKDIYIEFLDLYDEQITITIKPSQPPSA